MLRSSPWLSLMCYVQCGRIPNMEILNVPKLGFFLCFHLLFPMMENQQQSAHATIKSRNVMISLSPVEVARTNVEPVVEHLIH